MTFLKCVRKVWHARVKPNVCVCVFGGKRMHQLSPVSPPGANSDRLTLSDTSKSRGAAGYRTVRFARTMKRCVWAVVCVNVPRIYEWRKRAKDRVPSQRVNMISGIQSALKNAIDVVSDECCARVVVVDDDVDVDENVCYITRNCVWERDEKNIDILLNQKKGRVSVTG